MTLSKLNESLTLLANIGVIAGIVFLAVEVQQNTSMMQAQTRDAMTEKLVDWYAAISSSEFTVQSFWNSRAGTPGSELEQRAFLFMALGNIRIWENEWYQFQNGLFDETEFEARIKQWPSVINAPGYRRAWEATKETHSPDFVEYIDSLLEVRETQ